jgi:hypothetical protein
MSQAYRHPLALPSRLIRPREIYSTDLVFRKEKVDSCDVGFWSALLLRDVVCRPAGTVAASRARTATKPVHRHAPECDRMADDLGATPGGEIPRSSRRCGRTAESHSGSALDFCTFEAIDFRARRNLAKILVSAPTQKPPIVPRHSASNRTRSTSAGAALNVPCNFASSSIGAERI